MEYLILFGVFTLLMLIGTPIAFCLGISSLATVGYLGLPPLVVFQRLSAGISVFTLLPDGRLLHLTTLADTNGMTLSDVSSIKAVVRDGKIMLFVASATETGLTQLVLDPGQLGLTGRAGTGVVRGGLY